MSHGGQRKYVFRPPLAGSSPMYAVAAQSRSGGGRATGTATPSVASSTATSSRFSLSTAFVNLTERDVDFFDEVVDLVPQGASDFASLKRAYNSLLVSKRQGTRHDGIDEAGRSREERVEEEDAQDGHLWDTLLRLIQVRGRDWNQRWDAVRMAIGLDPRVASDGEATSASLGEEEDDDDDDDGSSPGARGTSDDGTSTEEDGVQRKKATKGARAGLRPLPTSIRGQEASPSANALLSRRQRDETIASQRRATEIEELRVRMEQLSARANSLVAAASAAHPPSSSVRPTYLNRPATTTATASAPRRQIRFADDKDERRLHPHRTQVESASDDERPPGRLMPSSSIQGPMPRPRSQSEVVIADRNARKAAEETIEQSRKRKEPQQEHYANLQEGFRQLRLDERGGSDRQGRQSHKESAMQRRFEDVIARSRSEREMQRQAEEAKREAEEEEARRAMYQQADLRLASTLTGKCLAWWLTLWRKRERLEEQTRRARNEVVQAKALVQWKTSWQRRETRLSTAGKLDLARCQLWAWRRWHKLVETQRQQRREVRRSELRGAYEQTRGRFEEGAQRKCFDAWRDAFLDRVAQHYRHTHLLSGALALWRIQLERSTLLDEHEQQVKRRIDDTLLQQCWQRWTVSTILSQHEMRLTTSLDNNLVGQSWQLWRQRASLSLLANTFADHRLKRSALLQWATARAARASQRRKEALADRWRARRSKRLALASWTNAIRRVQAISDRAVVLSQWQETTMKQISIKVWMLREREELLLRVTNSRIVVTHFQGWLHRFRSLRHHLSTREAVVQEKQERGVKESFFASWRHVTLQVVASQSLAAHRDCRKVRATNFAKWRQRLDQIQARESRADVIATQLAKRRALRTWIEAVRRRRLESVLAAKNNLLMTASWATWRGLAVERVRDRLAVAALQTRIDERVMRSALVSWTARVIERRSALLEAEDMRSGVLVRRSFDHWVRRCQRHEDRNKLCNSFVDVKREESGRRILHHWLARMRVERDRREKVQGFQKRRRMATLKLAWDAWYDRLVESSLRPIESQVLDSRQEAAMTKCLVMWQRRTECLPAIRFHQALVLSHTLSKWRDTLPLVQGRRMAEQRDRGTMFAKAFYHWMDKAKMKRKLRAAARFGGPSAAARLRATSLQARKSGPFSSSPPDGKRHGRQTPIRPRRSSSVKGETEIKTFDDRIREMGWSSSLAESADLYPSMPRNATARETHRQVQELEQEEQELGQQPLPRANAALDRWRTEASRVFSPPPPDIESISEPSEVPTAPSSVPTELGFGHLHHRLPRRGTKGGRAGLATREEEDETRSEGTVMKINRSPRKKRDQATGRSPQEIQTPSVLSTMDRRRRNRLS